MRFRHLTAAIVAAILAFTSNAALVALNRAISFDENYSSTLGTFVAVAANAEATNAPLVPTTASFATLVTREATNTTLFPTTASFPTLAAREESLETAQPTITITSIETSASMVNLDAWLSEEDGTQAESFISSSTTAIAAAPHFPNFPTRFAHSPVVPGKGFHPIDTIVRATSTPTSTAVVTNLEKQIKVTYLDFLASNPEFVVPIPLFMPPLVTASSSTPPPTVI
jgi:hypothetical protein